MVAKRIKTQVFSFSVAPALPPMLLQHPVPAVLLEIPVLTLDDTSLPSRQPLQLDASLILWGAHDEDVTRTPVTLNLTRRTFPVWRLGPAGQLFVQRMVSLAGTSEATPLAVGA